MRNRRPPTVQAPPPTPTALTTDRPQFLYVEENNYTILESASVPTGTLNTHNRGVEFNTRPSTTTSTPTVSPIATDIEVEQTRRNMRFNAELLADRILTNGGTNTQGTTRRCRFCSLPTNNENSIEVRGRRVCRACAAIYTMPCAHGCGNILVLSSVRGDTDSTYSCISFACPAAGTIISHPREQYQERWYCGCRLVSNHWRCNGGCHRFFDNSVVPALVMSSGHRKCTVCLGNHTRLMGRELPYNANVLDYLTPYPKSKTSDLQYGIEIEVQHKANHNDKINFVRNLLPEFVICKFDRSVTRRQETEGVFGFEIVSVPATLEDHKKEWPKLLDAKHGLYSWKHGDCGMHVHITRKALTPLQIGRMLKFVNSPCNAELMSTVADRYSNTYCKILDKKITDAHRLFRDGGRLYHELASTNHEDRYEALNVTNRNTVELRIFRGNLKKESFFKNLEFTDALVHFCRDCSISNLRTNPFLEFVSKRENQYPNLIKFLVKKGFDIPQVLKQKAKNYTAIEERLTEKAKTNPKYVEHLAAFKKYKDTEKEMVFSAL